MNKILFFAFLILGMGGIARSDTLAVKAETPRTLGSWAFQENWSLSGVYAKEAAMVSESTRADVAGSLEISRNFDDVLEIRLVPAFRFVTGRDQDVFSDRLPKDKIYADEAKARWTPIQQLGLEAGAINQAHLGNDLLVDSRPFPAARADFNAEASKTVSLSAAAQIAIPSSYTLEAQATGNEPLPKLQTYSAGVSVNPTEEIGFGLGATYFQFNDLPQIVAVSSARLGNTVDIFSSTTGRFRYDYQGVAAQADASFKLGSYDLSWKGQLIRNSSAPSDMGTGYVSSLGLEFPVTAVHELGFNASYYRIQSDTAPAYYTDAIFANNRIGSGGSIYLNHNRWDLQFKVSYFKDTPYYQNNLMGDRDLFLISIGNFYDDKTSVF